MYLNDVFTVTVNMAGLPGIAVPAGLDAQGLPLGLQLIGRAFDEETLFAAGQVIEEAAGRMALPEPWWARRDGARRPVRVWILGGLRPAPDRSSPCSRLEGGPVRQGRSSPPSRRSAVSVLGGLARHGRRPALDRAGVARQAPTLLPGQAPRRGRSGPPSHSRCGDAACRCERPSARLRSSSLPHLRRAGDPS